MANKNYFSDGDISDSDEESNVGLYVNPENCDCYVKGAAIIADAHELSCKAMTQRFLTPLVSDDYHSLDQHIKNITNKLSEIPIIPSKQTDIEPEDSFGDEKYLPIKVAEDWFDPLSPHFVTPKPFFPMSHTQLPNLKYFSQPSDIHHTNKLCPTDFNQKALTVNPHDISSFNPGFHTAKQKVYDLNSLKEMSIAKLLKFLERNRTYNRQVMNSSADLTHLIIQKMYQRIQDLEKRLDEAEIYDPNLHDSKESIKI